MIDVDDDVARRERADFAQEILGAARFAAAAAAGRPKYPARR